MSDSEATAASTDHRSEAIRGMRMLAQLLEGDPTIPLPSAIAHSGLTIQLLHAGTSAAAEMARIRAAIGGHFTKGTYGEDGQYFELCGRMAGLNVNVVAWRENVCKRVVTGTRDVTEMIPDPAAVAALPLREVTKTVEDFEWVCEPVLGAES